MSVLGSVELDGLGRMVVVHGTLLVSSTDHIRILRVSDLELVLSISRVRERARLGTPEQRLRRVERVLVHDESDYAYWPPLATSLPSEDGCVGSLGGDVGRAASDGFGFCPVLVRRRCRFVRRASTAESDDHREEQRNSHGF